MFEFFKKRRPVPDLVPDEAELRQWAEAEWIEYQAWLFRHGFVSLHDWHTLRHAALARPAPPRPRFSIVTPVFDTPPEYLRECLYSARIQSYPHWELCLVDDGSTRAETVDILQRAAAEEPRIRLHVMEHNAGICAATNRGIETARGDYVAFLDHDDRLAPDALSRVAAALDTEPATDIVYSDRDMLSPRNLRFMHLFKPDWSPETLLSGNYLFHLLVYRRELLLQLGGTRPEFEGSQDYDLILRAAETNPAVRHIPRVLYHWRQHAQSVSLAHNSKDYAYTAGLEALREHLARRGLEATVTENPNLWRGNYRVRLRPPAPERYRVYRLTSLEDYATQLSQLIAETPCDYLVLLGPGVAGLEEHSIGELVSWLQIPEVSLATGKVLDPAENFFHAGLVLRPDASLLALYRGHPETTAGYMAVTANVRNVSVPHPACCALDLKLLRELEASSSCSGPYALFDYALQLAARGRRCVYTPFARFTATAWEDPAVEDGAFVTRWAERLQAGDPCYNPHLTLELGDMGLHVGP